MRIVILIILIFLHRYTYSQIGELTGSVKDSSKYGKVQNAKMYFIKNDTTIYSGWGGNYSIVLKKHLSDTIIVSHYKMGTLKIPFKLKDKEKIWMDIHFPQACKSIASTDICPKCNSNKNVTKILYGKPTTKAMKEAKAGKIHLGGCMINDCSPIYFCKKDNLEF